MDADKVLVVARFLWLTLCGMMIFSRFLFQARGAIWMRAFLNAWMGSRTHTTWGFVALIGAVPVAAGLVSGWSVYGWLDRGVVGSLVLILAVDGLLNLLPGWFGHFKQRVQDAWVRKQRDPEKQGDTHLFLTVNIGLGVAASIVAYVVFSYRPIDFLVVAAAVVTAILATLGMVASVRSRIRLTA